MNEILKKYQDLMRLNDWDIDYVEVPALSSDAMTKTLYNDYKAIIQVNPSLNDVEKEKAIIHELLHLINREAYDIFNENVENEAIKNYCARQHERAIEKTAKIIYGLVHKSA